MLIRLIAAARPKGKIKLISASVPESADRDTVVVVGHGRFENAKRTAKRMDDRENLGDSAGSLKSLPYCMVQYIYATMVMPCLRPR